MHEYSKPICTNVLFLFMILYLFSGRNATLLRMYSTNLYASLDRMKQEQPFLGYSAFIYEALRFMMIFIFMCIKLKLDKNVIILGHRYSSHTCIPVYRDRMHSLFAYRTMHIMSLWLIKKVNRNVVSINTIHTTQGL